MLRWLPVATLPLLLLAACGGGDDGPTAIVTLEVDTAHVAPGDADALVDNVAGIVEKRAEYYFDDGVNVDIDGAWITLTIPDEDWDDRLVEGAGAFVFKEPVLNESGIALCGSAESPSGTARPSKIVESEDRGEPILVCGTTSDQVAVRPAQGRRSDGTTAVLNGEFIEREEVEADESNVGPIVLLSFDRDGSLIFEQVTQRNLQYPVLFTLDGETLSTPTVQSVITGGQTLISGMTVPETRLIAAMLRYGELPAPVSIVEAEASASLDAGG